MFSLADQIGNAAYDGHAIVYAKAKDNIGRPMKKQSFRWKAIDRDGVFADVPQVRCRDVSTTRGGSRGVNVGGAACAAAQRGMAQCRSQPGCTLASAVILGY